MRREDLFERSTISAEESAKWAKKSSDAANRIANTAARVNKIATIAIIVSVAVATMLFINGCTPSIQLFQELL